MRPLGLALLAAVAFFAVPAAPATPQLRQATLTGKLTGAKLPRASQGQIPVWAMRLTDGVVVAGTSASPSGRFTLRTPPGPYAILASLVLERGRRAPLVRVADFVTAIPGRRIAMKPTLKKRRKRTRRRRRARSTADVRAHAAWVDVDYPAIHVKRWTVPPGDPELKVLEKGLADMMITDLVSKIGTPDCPGAVVERERLADVISEIRLTQSRYFDPSHRMSTRTLIRENATVTGTLTRAGSNATLTATYTDLRTGRSGTVSVSGPLESIFALEETLSAKLVREVICVETPKAYSGSFSGTWTTQLNDYKVSWNGDAIIERVQEHGPPPEGAPPGDYAQFAVRSGRVHAVLDGTRGVCTVHGEADFQLDKGILGGQGHVQQDPPDGRPWYSLSIVAPGTAEIPYTETGFGCNQVDPRYPLTGVQFVFTEKPLQSADGRALTANTSWDQFSGSSHYTSAFSFTPSE